MNSINATITTDTLSFPLGEPSDTFEGRVRIDRLDLCVRDAHPTYFGAYGHDIPDDLIAKRMARQLANKISDEIERQFVSQLANDPRRQVPRLRKENERLSRENRELRKKNTGLAKDVSDVLAKLEAINKISDEDTKVVKAGRLL